MPGSPQSVVEQQRRSTSKTETSRELFVDKVWDWKRSLAVPSAARCADSVRVDWARPVHHEVCRRAVRTIFKRL